MTDQIRMQYVLGHHFDKSAVIMSRPTWDELIHESGEVTELAHAPEPLRDVEKDAAVAYMHALALADRGDNRRGDQERLRCIKRARSGIAPRFLHPC